MHDSGLFALVAIAQYHQIPADPNQLKDNPAISEIRPWEKMNISSRDAVMDEKENLVYKMRLVMTRSTMMVDGREVNLSPGMAVTAEVMTGKRRLIEFFLSPLIQYVDESVRER